MFEHLPAGWIEKSLSELASYANGYPFKPEDWKTQGLPIVRIAQLTKTTSHQDYYDGELPSVYRIESGDIIFSWSGTLKVVHWQGGPAWLNQHLFKVTPKTSVDPRFLYHVLQNSISDMKKRSHGSTMLHINRSELHTFKTPIPGSTDEQSEIANVLDQIEEKITQTQAIIAKLQQVKQGLLQDLLTRGVDQHGQLRPPHEKAPELYKESPLGWIPKEWEVSTIAEQFRVDSGITLGPHRKPCNKPHTYLRVANVKRDKLELNSLATLEASEREANSKALKYGDLLIVEGHASVHEIGRCAMADSSTEGMLFQNHLFRIRAHHLIPEFASMWMNSDKVKHYWRCESATSSGLNTINRTKLSAMAILCPEIQEQERVIKFSRSIKAMLATEEQNLHKLKKQKTALMDDLLTGRVRVDALLKNS